MSKAKTPDTDDTTDEQPYDVTEYTDGSTAVRTDDEYLYEPDNAESSIWYLNHDDTDAPRVSVYFDTVKTAPNDDDTLYLKRDGTMTALVRRGTVPAEVFEMLQDRYVDTA